MTWVSHNALWRPQLGVTLRRRQISLQVDGDLGTQLFQHVDVGTDSSFAIVGHDEFINASSMILR